MKYYVFSKDIVTREVFSGDTEKAERVFMSRKFDMRKKKARWHSIVTTLG